MTIATDNFDSIDGVFLNELFKYVEENGMISETEYENILENRLKVLKDVEERAALQSLSLNCLKEDNDLYESWLKFYDEQGIVIEMVEEGVDEDEPDEFVDELDDEEGDDYSNDMDDDNSDLDDEDEQWHNYTKNDDFIKEWNFGQGLEDRAKKSNIDPLKLYLKDISAMPYAILKKEEEVQIAKNILAFKNTLLQGYIFVPVNLKYLLDLKNQVDIEKKDKRPKDKDKPKLNFEDYIESLFEKDEEYVYEHSISETEEVLLSDKLEGDIDAHFEQLKRENKLKVSHIFDKLELDYKRLMEIYVSKPENYEYLYSAKQLEIVSYFDKINFKSLLIEELYKNMKYYRNRLDDLENEYRRVFDKNNLDKKDLYFFLIRDEYQKENPNEFLNDKKYQNHEFEKDLEKILNRLHKNMQSLEKELGVLSLSRFKNIYRTQIDFGYKGFKKYKEILIKCNVRLVIKTAQKFIKKNPINKNNYFSDLIQEGNNGLFIAVDKFDYLKGNKFSTYAVWWIRQAITRYISENHSQIRLPVHLIDMRKALQRITKTYQESENKEPSIKYLAIEYLKLEYLKKNNTLPENTSFFSDKELKLTCKKVKDVLKSSQPLYSLENDVGDDGNTTYAELIEDTQSESVEEQVHAKKMKKNLLKSCETELTEREAKVIQMRFGLNMNKDYTLEEIAKNLGVTRERVRQIESKAKQKLANSKLLQEQREFYSSPNKKKVKKSNKNHEQDLDNDLDNDLTLDE